ncbi:OmpA family protein [Mesonia aestuariivivens]|uniref:OmpA family protein n=1 Tax=Mesonia aestuariivivens TaxID=2796128 RepID=A0ABS6W4U0_9FLAO|nr:OmpA family protein [Mesonia aestuariivivens]MBW2962881.1 OmpA family protein [Mesonia aestuariivivens]
MKKLTLLFSLFIACSAIAQEENTSKEYNHWSIEAMGGVNKPSRPMTNGFYGSTPGFWNADLGVRYMINDKFGFKLNLGYNQLENDDDSRDFESKYYRTSIEGVVNLGTLLGFREWTNRLNLLGHAGAGVSRLDPGDNTRYDGGEDYMGTFVAGLTPQLRLSDHFALVGDLSVMGNVRQDYTWDGNSKTTTAGFNGMLVNASVGLNIYLGGAEKHADWVDVSNTTLLREELEATKERVAQIENDMMDEDQDGVPNYLDREPNTTSGVRVDSKGVAVDKNGNGIPDELESSLDKRYAKAGDNYTTNGSGSIAKLLNDGYVNVYFRFNSTQPETYSLEAINYLVKYMHENESASAELIGYADEIGNATYNQNLSEQRAKKVYDILIASGIEESRLSYQGGGVDNSVEKSSSAARQIVRRVTFKLK